MRTEILCWVCSKVLGTEDHPALVGGARKHPSLLCGNENEGCGRLYHKFRGDVNALNVRAAEMTRDLLTLRGATALMLHLKILETDEREAQRLAGFGADFNEAIKSHATDDELQMLGVKR
jgi:hypothetical protein